MTPDQWEDLELDSIPNDAKNFRPKPEHTAKSIIERTVYNTDYFWMPYGRKTRSKQVYNRRKQKYADKKASHGQEQ